MRSVFNWLVGVAFVVVVISAWGQRSAVERPRPQGETAAGDSAELIVGEPVRFRNLTIFPVSSRVLKDQDRFITLAEGLKLGLVSISEVGVPRQAAGNDPFAETADDAADCAAPPDRAAASADADDPFDMGQIQTAMVGGEGRELNSEAAQSAASDEGLTELFPPDVDGDDVGGNVNQLLLTNNSNQALYLMPGEILVGGKQDRTVAEEMVVAPHTKRLPIEVFCVESGRWSPRTREQSERLAANLTDGDAPADSRAQIASPEAGAAFSEDGGYLNKSGRLTVQSGKGQSAVWDEVRSVNDKTAAETGSDDFTANYADSEVAGRLEPYVAALEKAIADGPQVVGVIVAVNGEIQAADTFESTPLFRKLWPKLLKSYVLDAVTEIGDSEDEMSECDIAQAKTFLLDAIQAKVAASEDRDGLVTTASDSDRLACFSLHERTDCVSGGMGGGMGSMQGGMGGGFGGGVHSAAFSK